MPLAELAHGPQTVKDGRLDVDEALAVLNAARGSPIDEGVNETPRIVGLDVIAPAAGNNRSWSRSESDDVSHARF